MRRLAILIICACALPVSGAHAWTWPVDGPVLRPFSFDHDHPYAGGQHRGVDLGAPSGSPVLAPVEGVVSFAGTVPTGGKTVSIQTSFGYTTTLVHLGSIGVTRGAIVGEGSVVGTVGPSGVAELTEPYVYFGARLTSDPQGYVDPLALLPPRVASAPAPAPEAAVVAVADTAGSIEPAASAPAAEAAPVAAPAVDVASPAPEAAGAAPPSAAAPVEARIASGETPTIRPETTSPVTSDLAPPGSVAAPAAAASKARSQGSPVATHAAQPHSAVQAARVARPSFDDPQPQISRTTAQSTGRGWRLPAGLAVAATAGVVALRLRRKPLDTLPIMDSGDQLLHHDTDLLRQLDAPHRPRVHDDRGRHPHAPSQPAGRRDVLPDGNGRARLQGLPGGRGAGARPEDVRRPDRRSLERAA